MQVNGKFGRKRNHLTEIYHARHKKKKDELHITWILTKTIGNFRRKGL